MKMFIDSFGTNVFDDEKMKKYLSKDIYLSLKKTIEEDQSLDENVAKEVADAMKEWALSLGATHFSHWFQPLSGITAEKHDSFINYDDNNHVITEFSGKELIKGEPDASSFPSGGLRATFEARGYTAWDPTSYAFVKGKTLYIPTAFCSYGGDALDKKTPLLRSMEAINQASLRVLRALGNKTVTCVKPVVGPEQEYFLVPKAMFDKRDDLKFCGRTLFGASPAKGQDIANHYYGAIEPAVQAYMDELNEELWKLGVYAKTEHNEVAPAQHELAVIYEPANNATDHNQIVMNLMQTIALKHDLVCLLHEKPFAGVNGSGKHNNWSLMTNDKVNLFKPGDTEEENMQFLLFLSAVIKAVDKYQSLLRISVAQASNDNRLGASEAPPAIVSIFLGDDLTNALNYFCEESSYKKTHKTRIKLGVDVLPDVKQDTTDRNRTSPFAFTGNKFEFRMLGSANTIADANVAINSSVAEVLGEFALKLEGSKNINETIHEIIQDTVKNHSRIIFNGNGYDDEWTKEAVEKRGLLNLPTTPDALIHLTDEENVKMLMNQKIFNMNEITSRLEIGLENYSSTKLIEARVCVTMAKNQIIPTVLNYEKELLNIIKTKKDLLLDDSHELSIVKEIIEDVNNVDNLIKELEKFINKVETISDEKEKAFSIKDNLINIMTSLRKYCDKLESITPSNMWPMPTYKDLMFGVKERD